MSVQTCKHCGGHFSISLPQDKRRPRACPECARRICVACDHRFAGPLACPECGEPGEPLPRRGAPTKADKRKPAVKLNGAEKAKANELWQVDIAAGRSNTTSMSAWVRERCGL